MDQSESSTTNNNTNNHNNNNNENPMMIYSPQSQDSATATASSLQAEELLNSLLWQGAFGTTQQHAEEPPMVIKTNTIIPFAKKKLLPIQDVPQSSAAQNPSSPSPTNATKEPSPPEFFNHGLALWEQNRQIWLQRHNQVAATATTQQQQQQRHAMELDVDDIIDTLFAASRPAATPQYFSMSIPLPQMIDILQDLWEAEGLET